MWTSRDKSEASRAGPAGFQRGLPPREDSVDQGEVLVRKDGRVLYLTIKREKALNALNRNILERLAAIFEDLEKERDTPVVGITGYGPKAFVAGADVREIKDAGAGRTEFIRMGQRIFHRIMTSSGVVIAAVNGYALGGGCELALACDIRIASENASMGMPETGIGVMPGYGGTQLLSRLLHVGMAKYMILSGTSVNASEALQLGLVEKVYPRSVFVEEVEKFAQGIASRGPIALECCKRAIDNGIGLPLREALEVEIVEYDRVARSRDAEEGLSAFLEKRKPVFTGA